MENLNNVPSSGTFGNSINQVNHNFGLVKVAIDGLEGRTIRSKGLFPTQAALVAAYPSPIVGDYAYVGDSLPATIYDCLVAGTWHNTGQTGGSETVDLTNYATKADVQEVVNNITKDDALDTTSENLLPNSVVATAIDRLSEEIEDKVGPIDDEVTISLSETTNGTWAITDGVIAAGSNSSNYRRAAAIDVTPYYKLRLLFYLKSSHNSKAAFADDNGVVIGGPIYNTTGGYREFFVPEGATKLYLSTHVSYVTHNAAVGIIRHTVKEILDNTEAEVDEVRALGDEFTEIDFSSKADINYRIYSSTGNFGANKTDKHFFLPVVGGATYKVISNETTYGFHYAWTTGTTDGYTATPDYCEGETNEHSFGIGLTRFITAPSDAKYICITSAYQGSGCRPAYFGRYRGLKERLDTLDAEKIIMQSDIESLKEDDIYKDEIDISAASFSPINYRILAGTGKFSTKNTDKHINVPVKGGTTYRMVCVGAQYYAWVTQTISGSAYGKTPYYCEGETVRSASGTVQITAPADAKFITLTVQMEGNNRRPTYFAKIIPLLEKTKENSDNIASMMESGGDAEHEYYGEKIQLHPKYGWLTVGTCDSHNQSMACYDAYTIGIPKGMYQMQMRKMTSTLVLTYAMTERDNDIYHGNQCSFGTLRYDANDFFPLLYVSCNNNNQGRCFEEVYRIIPTVNQETGEFSSFTAALIQTIYLPAMNDTNCLGRCNVVIDKQRNMMFTYSRNDRDGAENKGIGRITRFRIPAIFDSGGNVVSEVYYEDTDIVDSYDPGIGSIGNNQGGDILNGKLFIARGGAGVGYTYLYCVDLIQKRLVAMMDMLKDGFNLEPEGVFFYNGNLHISTNSATIIRMII